MSSTKRHTAQNEKQRLGQFYTTNADYILNGYENVVSEKNVIDPFSGNGDLLKWAKNNNANSVEAYDIFPIDNGETKTIKNDSLTNPPSYTNSIVLSNPPYLSKNKCKSDKTVFEQWNQNDYYKCHLASLNINNCEEGLFIIPSNFLCESSPKARNLLFYHYDVISAKYWTFPIFDDATTGITLLHIKKKKQPNELKQIFPMKYYTSKETYKIITVILEKKYGYLNGKDFFEYINNVPKIRILKTDVGDPEPNTKIVVSLLEHGKHPFGISINEKESDIYCKKTSFTTYQVSLPDYVLSLEQQRQIVNLFQDRLHSFKDQYLGMFLSNYMGANQKILSRTFVSNLLSRVISELEIKTTMESCFFG